MRDCCPWSSGPIFLFHSESRWPHKHFTLYCNFPSFGFNFLKQCPWCQNADLILTTCQLSHFLDSNIVCLALLLEFDPLFLPAVLHLTVIWPLLSLTSSFGKSFHHSPAYSINHMGLASLSYNIGSPFIQILSQLRKYEIICDQSSMKVHNTHIQSRLSLFPCYMWGTNLEISIHWNY